MDKVQGGTPKSGNSLCFTCSNGVLVKGFGQKEIVHCIYTGRLVHFSVCQCSKYISAATPALNEMHKIAWVIESRNRGTWGFNGERQTEIVVRPPGHEQETPVQVPSGNKKEN